MEPASVIGLSFPEPAIEELVPDALRVAVPAHLRALSRKQFVDRVVNNTSEDEIYRFRNLMIKDAVYASLLKRARATLHERFVTWAERVNRERGREQEFEEIHGYHLEQAYRYRTELGPLDAEGRAIAERASAKLANAGPACLVTWRHAGLGLAARAGRRGPPHGVPRAARDPVRPRRGDDRPRSRSTTPRASIDRGRRIARADRATSALVARMAINGLMLDQFTGDRQRDAPDRGRARRSSRSSSDTETTSRWPAHGIEVTFREITLGQYEAATVSSDRLVDHARRGRRASASPRQAAPAVAYLMIHGATPVAEGIRRCDEAARQRPRQPARRGDRPRRPRAVEGDGRGVRRGALNLWACPDHPVRARGKDRRQLNLHRGLAGRDPRRRPGGGRSDAPARRRGARRSSTSTTSARRSRHPRQRARAARGRSPRPSATQRSPRSWPTRTTSGAGCVADRPGQGACEHWATAMRRSRSPIRRSRCPSTARTSSSAPTR